MHEVAKISLIIFLIETCPLPRYYVPEVINIIYIYSTVKPYSVYLIEVVDIVCIYMFELLNIVCI